MSTMKQRLGSAPQPKISREQATLDAPEPIKAMLDVAHLLTDHFQGIDQRCQSDRRRALLVIVPDRDLGFFAQSIQDTEAFRLGDILQVHPAQAGLQHQHRVDDHIRVLGIQHDRDAIYSAQVFIQQRLALHHRQTGFGTDVAQPQTACHR